MNLKLLLIVATVLGGVFTFSDQASAQQNLDFELKDSDGKLTALRDFSDSKVAVVAFLGVECPLVKLYASRLQEIADKYESDSVQFFAINSNRQDSITEIKSFVRRHAIKYPMLKDPGNKIADAFDAKRTPEVFVLNKARKICYRGAIDDQYTYGVQQEAAKNHFLRNAIDALLTDEKIEVAKTDPPGCIIGRQLVSQNSSDVTFSNQIVRILQNRCVRCHREGELAPFALEDYDEVVGWAGMIEEVIRERRMPPWHAESSPGQFKNDCQLSEKESNLIYQWVAAGAPEGDREQLPPKMEFADGWQIGKPDVVIDMRKRPYKVPATGTVNYKYFKVKTNFKEDKWVKAAECVPGARQVVHHIIVGIAGQGEFGRSRGGMQSEWIAATAPGAPPLQLPSGYAKLVPAGATLVFQMHYTPNGTAQEDLSKIGLVFAEPKEVKKQVMTLMSFNPQFRIPPGEESHKVISRYRFDQDVELMTLFPHMHYRGKKFRYEIKRPEDAYETVLNVPRYDFNWQNAYELSEYQMIPKGSRMRCTAYFDNSEKNLANPNPKKTVRWGDQTWEEMMIGYFDVAVPVSNSDRTNQNR